MIQAQSSPFKPVRETLNRRAAVGGRCHGIALIGLLVSFCLRTAARADLASVQGVYDEDSVLFEVAFNEPARDSDEWQFVLFIDEDGDRSTGYGSGYDKLVRGVEFDDLGRAGVFHTSGGGGPGGWGTPVSDHATVRVAALGFQNLEFEIPIGVNGVRRGDFRYALEFYDNGSLAGATALQDTVSAATTDDDDEDGVADAADNCPKSSNADQADTDEDGIGDACDLCPFDDLNDANDNGICDADERPASDRTALDAAADASDYGDTSPDDDRVHTNDSSPPEEVVGATARVLVTLDSSDRRTIMCGSCGPGIIGAAMPFVCCWLGVRLLSRRPRRRWQPVGKEKPRRANRPLK